MLRKLFCSQVTWKVAKVVDGDERERGVLRWCCCRGLWLVGSWFGMGMVDGGDLGSDLQQHATNQKSSPSLFPRFQFILTHTYGYSGV